MKNKINTTLLLFSLLLTNLLMAQSPTVFDVVPGQISSSATNKIEIGDKLFFQYTNPSSGNQNVGYIAEDGGTHFPVYNLPSYFQIGNVIDGIMGLNTKPYWIQSFFNYNNSTFVNVLCTIENDSVQFLYDPNLKPTKLIVYNNDIYVTGYTDTTSLAIFKYDGSVFTLSLDLLTADGTISQMKVLNSKLFFLMKDNSNDYNFIVEYNGTTFIHDTLETPTYYTSSFLVNKNDSIFFQGIGVPNNKLYCWYNGAFTTSIFNLVISDAEVIGNDLYYSSNDTRINKYNLNTGINVGIPGPNPSYNSTLLTQFNDKLYFQIDANAANFYYALTYIDPIQDTAKYVEIPFQNGDVDNITSLGNEMYFSASVDDPISGTSGIETFRFNNGNPEIVVDLNLNNNFSSFPYDFVYYQGNLAMSAAIPQIGNEIVVMCLNIILPIVPVSQIVCENETISSLQATGSSLVWYDAATLGNLLPTSNTITQSGTYYVATRHICESNRVSVPFTISTSPSNVAAYFGDSLIKVINPTASYQWINCTTGDSIVGATSQSLNVSSNDSYQCILTNTDGCTTISNCVYVVNLSVAENLKNTVNIFPNPAMDEVKLKASENIGSISISNLTGQILSNDIVNAMNYTLNVSAFSNGIYLVLIYDQNQQLISKQKLMIEK